MLVSPACPHRPVPTRARPTHHSPHTANPTSTSMPSGPKQLMTPPISDGPRQRAKSTPNHALRSAPLVSLLSAVPLPPPPPPLLSITVAISLRLSSASKPLPNRREDRWRRLHSYIRCSWGPRRGRDSLVDQGGVVAADGRGCLRQRGGRGRGGGVVPGGAQRVRPHADQQLPPLVRARYLPFRL
jgi:hypothetical protein